MELKFDHRRTMRGIRKCTQCGTFNGNRAIKCKNQLCQRTLNKIPQPAKRDSLPDLMVVKLLQTGYTNGQVYSVRDGHSDGLRNIIRTNISADGTLGALTIIQGNDISDTGNVTQIISSCKSMNTAEALPFAKETISALAISEEEKLSLWERRCHAGGPLVQRVSSDLFVVGHWPSAYGLCHVVALKKNQKYSHFHCDSQNCEQTESSRTVCWHMQAVAAGLLSAPDKGDDLWADLLQQFVCQKTTTVLDGVPDENAVLSYEYFLAADDAGFISVPSEHIEIQSMLNSTYMELLNNGESSNMDTDETTNHLLPTTSIPDIFPGGEESLHLMDCQIELMDELDPTDRIDFCPSFIECEDSLPAQETEDNSQAEDLVRITTKKGALKRSGKVTHELTRGSYSVRKLMNVLESNGIIFNRLQHVSGPKNVAKSSPTPAYEATQCSLSFTCWLESVIEQLNSVIDYNTDGKPAVQTFRIQEDFFRCLRARFSIGHRLRQPERADRSTDTESDRSQRYKFTHHKSLLHVFRTDKIALCFEKKFKRGADDRYVPLEDDESEPASEQESRPIRPHSYTTYIKLGRYRHEPDPERVYYFLLEWIDGVLPRSGFGELRISFQYGHRMNKQYLTPPGRLLHTE
ncbi:uncharacterized protein C2orf42 homolog [Anopheles marshallii]|uniref:uncharacterized protein C2orf42 homolog n=1 Tax=Anopheles marshallii TaxID=1521116 RepID=UPI00237A8124|nr:uncharacterized protein C2orf42 homolog [Anopheles marshallii]